MAPATLPPRDLVLQLLRYDAATGEFIWKPRANTWWNGRYAGKTAGSVKPDGRVDIAIGHRIYKAHRLVWLYIHGEPVPDVIDHVDHNRRNNRFSNLRAATKLQNGANSRVRKNNTTGVKGVGLWHGYYRARIMYEGKDITIGCFKTLEEAAKARFEAASRLHGTFARHE